MLTLYTETSGLRVLKIMPKNLNEIIRSWIHLWQRTKKYKKLRKSIDSYFQSNIAGHSPFNNIFFSKVWWLSATLFLNFIFFSFYTFYNHIHTAYLSISISPGLSPFLRCLLLRGKNLHGVPSRDLNSGRPAHYQLSYAIYLWFTYRHAYQFHECTSDVWHRDSELSIFFFSHGAKKLGFNRKPITLIRAYQWEIEKYITLHGSRWGQQFNWRISVTFFLMFSAACHIYNSTSSRIDR
jgi:hypothetical protein